MHLDTIARQLADVGPEHVVAAYRYLRHYGHLAGAVLSGAAAPSTAVAEFARALIDVQAGAGLTPTGRLDEPTAAVLARPRCGCPDRLRLADTRWRKRSLTYCVTDYVAGLSASDQDELIRRAWQSWADVADVSVTPTRDLRADVLISTGRGPAQGFDGPAGTLAWAYLPDGRDGQLQMRFDLDERWVRADPDAGILFLNVSAHEFGHLLGLAHSQRPGALMAPIYAPSVSRPQADDDVPRIQALYGPPPGRAPEPAPRRGLTIEIAGAITGVSIPGFTVTPQ